MHPIEIAGHLYMYRNGAQLSRMLEKKQEGLAEDETSFIEKLMRVRNEKKAIAKYLGVPLHEPEVRFGSESQGGEDVEKDVVVQFLLLIP